MQLDLTPLGGGTTAQTVEAIGLNLFEDVSLTAVRDRIERRAEGRYTWFGSIPGDPLSEVILTAENGVMAGNIVYKGRTYQIRPAAGKTHEVREIDQSAFPPEADPLAVLLPMVSQDATPLAAADDGSIIDVMVVYTPAARAAEGGTANILAAIQLGIDETNQSYLNSGITQRVSLVHAEEVAYVESGNFSTDLSRITNPGDGYSDNVHALRDTYHADLVSLWVQYSSNSCGIGYRMDPVADWFEAYAFTVINAPCATGYYSFGHEMGHNMAAHHDRYVVAAGDEPAYPYAYGFVDTAHRWRTIMAYNDECYYSGFNCTRIQYWSNPAVFYSGFPTGIAEGLPDAADNRKTLNNTAYTVANFRAGCTYSLSSSGNSFSPAGGNASVTVNTQGGCDWNAVSNNASWLHVTSGTSGTGDGTVGYSIDQYTETGSRQGTMTIGGQTFTVTQTGCSYTLNPASSPIFTAAGAAAQTFSVTTNDSICPWTASEGLTWVSITSGSGPGSGTVTYSVNQNSDVAWRSGNIILQDKTFVITQTGVLPTANFSASLPSGDVPFQVTFTNLSNNATSWLWEFGDGETSALENPTHTYQTATGSPFTVRLTATNINGSDMMTQTVSASSCANGPVRYSGTSYPVDGKIGTAYSVAAMVDELDIQAIDFIIGSLTFGENKDITLRGGYDCSYSPTRIPDTVIEGSLTISGGKITFDAIVIR